MNTQLQMTPRIQKLRDDLVKLMPIQKATDRTNLAGKYITDVVVQYLTYKARMIRPRRRTVVIWPDVFASRYYSTHQADVARLKTEFEAGVDVNAALSNLVRSNVYAGDLPQKTSDMTDEEWVKKAWKGKDKVRVLYDVHHLHLGIRQPDGSVDRTGPLLFVGVGSDHAFFLTLGDHNSFDDGTISKIMWDKLEAKATADGGGAYLPLSGGVTLGGTKVTDTLSAIKIVSKLEKLDKMLDENKMSDVNLHLDWDDIVLKDNSGKEIRRLQGQI